jgi:hypothetical protein
MAKYLCEINKRDGDHPYIEMIVGTPPSGNGVASFRR